MAVVAEPEEERTVQVDKLVEWRYGAVPGGIRRRKLGSADAGVEDAEGIVGHVVVEGSGFGVGRIGAFPLVDGGGGLGVVGAVAVCVEGRGDVVAAVALVVGWVAGLVRRLRRGHWCQLSP